MNLYLDDDTCGRELTGLLRKARHDVMIPADVKLAEAPDAVHFLFAIRNGRSIVSFNYRDFQHLHDLVTGSGGRHVGVLVVRQDNNRAKDMKPGAIAAAVAKLVQSGLNLTNQYIVLNDYR